MNENHEYLFGQRVNRRVQGYWFTPGGRVFNNESQEAAFLRISRTAPGVKIPKSEATLPGAFDHVYEDSVFGIGVSTHYINTPYLVRLDKLNTPLP